MNKVYVIEYLHENEFRKKERAVKKYNMLAYKKLVFEYYSEFREGNFSGVAVNENKNEGIIKYELKLPTDAMFSKVYGDIILHYTVYENQKIVMLDNITPDDILSDAHKKELTSYKGVPISKSHAEKDMFKINLLNMLGDTNYSSRYNRSGSSSVSKVNKESNSKKEKKVSKKSDAEIVKNLVKNKEIDKYLNEWQEGISYFNSKDDSSKQANACIDKIEKLLDNSFDNMDYYKKKFSNFIIIYLNKKKASFMEIKNEFINYLLNRNKDEIFEFNTNMLVDNVKFDLSIMSWIDELLLNDILIKLCYKEADKEDNLYLYRLNKNMLNKNQIKALRRENINYWCLFCLVIFIVLLPFISKYNNPVIERYIINNNLNSYNKNIHTKENISYLKRKLEINIKDSDELIDLIYSYKDIVFVDKNNYRKGNYYLEMSDDFYNEFINMVADKYNKTSNYYNKYKDIGSTLCENFNSNGGISYLGNYRIEYIYNNKSYYQDDGMSYNIYYYDNTLLENNFMNPKKCKEGITPISLLEDYNKMYKYYMINNSNKGIKINLEDKIITFYNKSDNIEFNLYTYNGYKYGKYSNIITLEWE